MTSTADEDCEEHVRVLQNEYMAEHLFSFLSLNDIKNCRLINKMWCSIGTKILRRRTYVLFDFSDRQESFRFLSKEAKMRVKRNKLKKVSDLCKATIPENTPISSFTFIGEIPYLPLNSFLKDVRNYMTELKIVGDIYHKERIRVDLDLSTRIIPHLTKLHIKVPLFHLSNVTFSLRFAKIPFVKDIFLDNCTIILDSIEKRLSATAITLWNKNKYIKNGVNTQLVVNEYFDLKLAKNIYLWGEKLIVDFSDCPNDKLERNVTLNCITVRNWEMCSWKIKKFSLNEIDFLDKNLMEMEELTTRNLRIDLSKIYNPFSIKKLDCKLGTKIKDASFFLTNLVDLALECKDCVAKLPYFTKHNNISTMLLHNEFRYTPMSVHINDLPKGINQLSLNRVAVHGDSVYRLNTLYMGHYDRFTEYQTFVNKFQGQTLAIDIGKIYDRPNIVSLLNATNYFGRLIIGDFHCDKRNSIIYSVLSNFVDKEARYYVFEGKRGKGITDFEDEREFGSLKRVLEANGSF